MKQIRNCDARSLASLDGGSGGPSVLEKVVDRVRAIRPVRSLSSDCYRWRSRGDLAALAAAVAFLAVAAAAPDRFAAEENGGY